MAYTNQTYSHSNRIIDKRFPLHAPIAEEQERKPGTREYKSERKTHKKCLSVPKDLKPRPKSPDPAGLKRRTLNRGDSYNNIQVTHIILFE